MAPEPVSAEVRHGAFRYSNYDTPFWSRPNSEPGRWHVRADGPTQYLSLSPSGAWAELIRYEQLRSEAEVASVRISFWVVDLKVAHVADYRTFDRAEAAGFDPSALVEDDYERCQREGQRLRQLGYTGVMAPSAALPGATNVTLFGPRYSIRWGARVVTSSAVPAAVAAVGGPPPGLLPSVRQRGEAHDGLRHHVLARAAERERERRSPADGD